MLFSKKEKRYNKHRLHLDFSNSDESFFKVIADLRDICTNHEIHGELQLLQSHNKYVEYLWYTTKKEHEYRMTMALSELRLLIALNMYSCDIQIR